MSTSVLSQFYRSAFVTGASTGLGRAFAEMLLQDGVRVWGTSRDAARLSDLVELHPGRFVPVVLELADLRVTEVFARVEADADGFDVAINNAGYGLFAEFAGVPFEAWQSQVEVMLVQPMRLTHAALRGMLARKRGAIVNVSSLAAEFPLPFQPAYNVAKAGLTAFNESLMIELEGSGVSVIDFRPGDYRTDFERSVQRPGGAGSARLQRTWDAFAAMMRSGPPPAHAAAVLRQALLRRRSGTVRTGRFFQAVIAPFLARFGSLALKRRIQARYFDVT